MPRLLDNPAFPPGLHPQVFTWWTNKGFLRIADFCDHRGVLSKPYLPEKYQLSNPELFLFTQITHFLANMHRISDLTSSTDMEYLCRNFDKYTGHISKIDITLNTASSQAVHMNKWGHDMNETLEVEDWCKLA